MSAPQDVLIVSKPHPFSSNWRVFRAYANGDLICVAWFRYRHDADAFVAIRASAKD